MWETNSELSNDYFEVQYTIDGIEFETLATIDGSGTSQEAQTYLFTHQMADPGIHYYRLVQFDFNGERSESSVIAIDNTHDLNNSFFSNLYPNPTNDAVNFVYLSNDAKSIDVEVTSLSSWEIEKEITFTNISSGTTISIPVRDLDPGMYILSIRQGEHVDKKRFVVIK